MNWLASEDSFYGFRVTPPPQPQVRDISATKFNRLVSYIHEVLELLLVPGMEVRPSLLELTPDFSI